MRVKVVDGLASVIVPVFNRAGLLAEAVESALAQTYRPIEVVIVDDASTDTTLEAALSLERAHPGVVRVVRRAERGGPGPAKNSGLGASRAEFVQFLDSDDLLMPGKLEAQIDELRKRPDCGVVYCRSARVESGAARRASHRTGEAFDRILPGFLISRGWPTLAPVWRRAVCEAIGGFTDHAVLEDWLWDVKAGLLETKLAYCPEELCVVRDLDVPRAGRTLNGYSREQWRAAFAARREAADLLRARGREVDLGASGFARSTFQMARQCALLGFAREAKLGVELASSFPADAATRAKLAAFRAIARWAGEPAAARLVEAAWRIASPVLRPLRAAEGHAG